MSRGRRKTACLKSCAPGKGRLVLWPTRAAGNSWSRSLRPSGGSAGGGAGRGVASGGCWSWRPWSLCSAVSPCRSVGASGLEGVISPRPWRRTGSCGGSGGCRLSMRHKSKVRGRFGPGLLWRPRVSAVDLQTSPERGGGGSPGPASWSLFGLSCLSMPSLRPLYSTWVACCSLRQQ